MKFPMLWVAGVVALALAFAMGCGSDNSKGSGAGTAGSGGASAGAAGSSGSATGGSAGSSAGGSGPAGAAGSSGGSGGSGGATDDGGTGGATDGGSDSSDAKSTDGPPSDATKDSPGDATTDAAAYDPCPAKGKPCVILPVGDSITWGAGSSDGGSYRKPLFHLAHMNTQSITFVGSLADGPQMVDGVLFPRNHEGHAGYNIDATQGRMGVSPLFPGAITAYKPNIVLLMIGTNDVDTGEDMIPVRLGMLLDSMLAPDPKLLVVVAQIVPQQIPVGAPDSKNTLVKAYNAAIPGVVKTRVDAGKHVVVVDMFGAFTANPNFSTALLTDKLHPNDAGFAVMADTWYAAIKPYLK